MKYKNFIWDFDGTLFDSYPHICACLLKVLEQEGIREKFEAEMVMRHLCVSFGDAKTYTGISDEAWRKFSVLHHLTGAEEEQPPVVPFADCEKVLRDIMAQGGRHFLYTHRNLTALEYVRNFSMEDLFEDYVTSEDGFPAKPAPDAILAIMERNGLEPAETIMIGDREIDGRSGKNAGIAGALVNAYKSLPDGTDPYAVSQMDYVAENLSELWEKLQRS